MPVAGISWQARLSWCDIVEFRVCLCSPSPSNAAGLLLVFFSAYLADDLAVQQSCLPTACCTQLSQSLQPCQQLKHHAHLSLDLGRQRQGQAGILMSWQGQGRKACIPSNW